MKTIKLCTFLSIIFNMAVCKNVDLIQQFLSKKQITHAIVVWCQKPSAEINKSLSSYRLRIAVMNSDTFLKHLALNGLNINISPIGIVLDLACKNASLILQEASSQNMFLSQYKWLLLNSDNNVDLTKLEFNIESDVTMTLFSKSEIKIYEIYKIGNRQGLIQNCIGKWTRKYGLIIEDGKLNKRNNLNGIDLRIAIVLLRNIKGSVMKYLNDDQDLTEDSMIKDTYTMLRSLAALYNFKLQIHRAATWGYVFNGTFNGMMGMLQRGEIDIGGSVVYLKTERMAVSDVIAEARYQKVALIFRHPHTNGGLSGVFLAPLEDNAWIGTVICMIVTSIIMIFILSINQYKKIKISIQLCGEIILSIIGSLCQQGLSSGYDRLSLRISSLTLLVFSVLIYQFYSASIVSSLLKDPPITIKTPEDFLNSNLHMKVEDIYYHHLFFKTSTREVVGKLYQNKVNKDHENNFVPTKLGVELIKKGNTGFLLDVDNGYTQIANTFSMLEICDLCEIMLEPIHHNVAITRKNSPYRKLLAIGYRKIFEHGIAKKEEKRWHPKKPKCIKELIHKEFAVDMKHVSSVFIMLICGILLSCTLLIFEIYFHKL